MCVVICVANAEYLIDICVVVCVLGITVIDSHDVTAVCVDVIHYVTLMDAVSVVAVLLRLRMLLCLMRSMLMLFDVVSYVCLCVCPIVCD